MIDENLYKIIWESQGPELLLSRTETSQCYRLLAYSILGDVQHYRETIQTLGDSPDDPICIEADLVMKSKTVTDISSLVDLANMVLTSNSNAVFANRVLGLLSENKKKYPKAFDYYKKVLDTNPNDIIAITGTSRVLYYQTEANEALVAISRIQEQETLNGLPLGKKLYWYLLSLAYKVAFYMRTLKGIIFSLILILLLILPISSMPVFIIILGISTIGALYFFKKDNFALTTFIVIIMEAIFVFLIGYVFRWLIHLILFS